MVLDQKETLAMDAPDRRLLKVRVPARLALALEARRLLSGESKSKTVEEALTFYLKRYSDAPARAEAPELGMV